MDRLGILCSACDCSSGPVGACAVRAHVSHSTPLVACRLSFRVPFSNFHPLLVVTPSSADYSPPQLGRGEQGLDVVVGCMHGGGQTGDY